MGIWDILGKVSVIGGVLGIAAYVVGIPKYIKKHIKHNSHLKRWIWKITGKKVHIEFKSHKKYYQNIDVNYSDMRRLLKRIVQILNEEFGGIEQDKKIGKNYIIIRPKTLNVPLSIEILPNIGLDYEISRVDLELLPEPLKEKYIREYSEELYSDEGKEIRIGTTISVKLFGALTLLYKEKEEYESLLTSVEKIYNEIEKYFRLENPFEVHYSVKAIVVTKDKEDSITLFEKKEYADWKIEIKGTRVILYSRTIEPLKKIFDEHLPRVPAF